MARGDHIFIDHLVFTHHGIDCGDGTVIHHTGRLLRKLDAVISRTSLDKFASGKQIFVQKYSSCDAPDIVIRRAESRLGKAEYNLFENNCEHFATWCKTGKKRSEQVENPIGVISYNTSVAVDTTVVIGNVLGEIVKLVPAVIESEVRHKLSPLERWFVN